MMQVHILGLDKLGELARKAKVGPEQIRVGIKQEVTFFGEAVVGTSRQRFLSGRPGLNVISGKLRSSIHYLVKEMGKDFTLDVGTDVPYAPVHEYGDKHGWIRPRPFLKPAVEIEFPVFVENVEKYLNQWAEKSFGK